MTAANDGIRPMACGPPGSGRAAAIRRSGSMFPASLRRQNS